MATQYALYAYLLPQETFRVDDKVRMKVPMTTVLVHRHGLYATLDLARWWAINTNGVWQNGDDGPRRAFYPRHVISYFAIEDVEV